MQTIHLRATDEAALADALPQLRGTDGDGSPCWLLASHHHALDPIGHLALTQAVVDPETGDVVTPAVIDDAFHANLRLLETHPEHNAIMAACEPFAVHPANPRRAFA